MVSHPQSNTDDQLPQTYVADPHQCARVYLYIITINQSVCQAYQVRLVIRSF